ncbi:MAG: exonuclease SbcCD subunit D [Actinomycetota bacterium]|jgi:exonuclease SbcD|nr:exonuclease SbcCD subunit D [Actinomycetota bacterium]
MRILHTSDWHVGRTIRGRSRAVEHEAVLAEIVAVARAEAVDLVLVAGDQFDTAAPAPDAERIVWRALLDLAEVAPVVVVAGNHDNPFRLDAVAPLLTAAGVHSGARLVRPDDGGLLTVQVASGETARIALLPFLSQRGIVRADELMGLDADQHAGRYDARAKVIIERLCEGFNTDTVNLAVAHLMVAGGVLGGGERTAHTIFDYAVAATAFPDSAHYVALGHLHRTQSVPAACPAWYSGSALQLDFGEAGDSKAVVLVEAAPGRPAEVRTVELSAGRRLRTLRGTLDELEALAGTTGDDYLRVIVPGQQRAGMAEQVREWFDNAIDVGVEAPDSASPRPDAPWRLGRSPVELFSEYLSDRDAADERVLALFYELFDAAHAPDAA